MFGKIIFVLVFCYAYGLDYIDPNDQLVCNKENEIIDECGARNPPCSSGSNCLSACQPTCECKLGYQRDENNNECVQPICKKNQIINPCGIKLIGISFKTKCLPKCECKSGYAEDSFGNCKPIPKCPQNEKWLDGGSPCQTTCENIGQPCNIQTLVPVNGCYCVDGYARDKSGKCIPISACPSKLVCLLKNEIVDPCATKLWPPCLPPTEDEVFPCEPICQEGCVCKKGFIRDTSGNCIDPNPELNCSENEFVNPCGTTIQVQCITTPCDPICYPTCDCKPGYIREPSTGICVLSDKKCPKNENWIDNGSPCQTLCTNYYKECKIKKIAPVSGCYCNDGYARDECGTCIEIKNCPPVKCPNSNEVLKLCSTLCEPTVSNPDPICVLVCGPPRCQCRAGYLRTPKGKCIKRKNKKDKKSKEGKQSKEDSKEKKDKKDSKENKKEKKDKKEKRDSKEDKKDKKDKKSKEDKRDKKSKEDKKDSKENKKDKKYKNDSNSSKSE